ncbi:cysteine--tRNA ligase [Planctomycetota bacterium]|nr:cysteine--tRNA ligase [Planctomycetota bacterium]
MALQLHSTLTRRKLPFAPLADGKVGMYLCGPTVYSDCHIGHLMGPVLFDAVARWFAVRGFQVRFVNNITDIDDKIIDKANATGEPWQAITERYTNQYLELLKKLHVTTITDHPRCTEYVPQMVSYIEDLVARGRAYVAGDGVYYDVSRQVGYGKLSGRRLDEMTADAGKLDRMAGAAGGVRHPADFALWKLAKPGEPSWPSPWGDGRPGWHIECSVMSLHTLGATFDIHAGGEELKFPHHENEIAQGEAHGGDYARHWMHNNLVQYQGAKVSKSDPRMSDPAFALQFQAKAVVAAHGPAVVRFLLLNGHYRRPVDFSPENIGAVATALGRLHRVVAADLEKTSDLSLEAILAILLPDEASRHRADFVAAMDDDFNTGAAIAELFGLAHLLGKLPADQQPAVRTVVWGLGRLIGLFQPGDAAAVPAAADDDRLAKVMSLVLELRASARANRDFAASDRIRDRLKAAGIVVKDGKDGATWEFAP